MSILIQNGRIWNGTAFSTGDIWVEGQTVTKIAEHIDEKADFVFDATGKTVSAGLVDVHLHLRGISPKNLGMQGEMASFPFGATAVNDAWAVFGNKELLDSFMVKTTVFPIVPIVDNRARLDQMEETLARYGERAVGLKVYFDSHNPECRDIVPLREACEYATSKNLKVMVHCNHSPTSMREIVDTLRRGDILSHAFHGGANNALENDFSALKEAKRKGVYIDACMAGYVHMDFAIFRQAVMNNLMPDIISTDLTQLSAYKRGGRYGLTTCMSIARHSGMPEETIFQSVTQTPAKALGRAEVWGKLCEGSPADLAVFDYTNEPYELKDASGNELKSDKGYRCVLTIADGEVVFRD